MAWVLPILLYAIALPSVIVLYELIRRRWMRQPQPFLQPIDLKSKSLPGKDLYKHVGEAHNFDFRKEPPRGYRPFIESPHVAMGVEKVQKDDWIQMDCGYLDRLDERIGTMETYPQWAIGVNDISAPAILELFREVMVKHVPKRFPTMFRLQGHTFTNLITKKTYDIKQALKDPALALQTLCRNVEEDFYLMCPDGEGSWRLQGYISCFPGGFDGPSRMGMSFRDIHVPVPHYEERIANGVDKFVRRMKVGEWIQRFNWSLQVDGKDLFRLDGNNYYPEKGHVLPDETPPIDIDQCWLRYERQTLTVLEETKAIVFCVRLYMTSLRDIVAEGNGIKLADAIDSMPEKLGDYKKRPFWAQDVMKFLRQEI